MFLFFSVTPDPSAPSHPPALPADRLLQRLSPPTNVTSSARSIGFPIMFSLFLLLNIYLFHHCTLVACNKERNKKAKLYLSYLLTQPKFSLLYISFKICFKYIVNISNKNVLLHVYIPLFYIYIFSLDLQTANVYFPFV